MKALATTLVPILALLNWLAAPVSVIWLIALGEWWAVGLAFLSFFSHFLLAIALLPVIAFAVPAATLSRRSPVAAMIVGLPGLLYTAALITVWCMGTLTFLLLRATPNSWIPLLLLAFSIGTGPWTYMAQKEVQGGTGEGSLIAAFFAQIAFIAVIITVAILRPVSLTLPWLVFGAIMLIEVCIATVKGLAILREERDGNLTHEASDESGARS